MLKFMHSGSTPSQPTSGGIPGRLDPREMGVWSIPPVYIHRVWDEEFRLLHKSFTGCPICGQFHSSRRFSTYTYILLLYNYWSLNVYTYMKWMGLISETYFIAKVWLDLSNCKKMLGLLILQKLSLLYRHIAFPKLLSWDGTLLLTIILIFWDGQVMWKIGLNKN